MKFLDEFSPFEEMRDAQRKIVSEIVGRYIYLEKLFFVVEAPTGVGKSGIALGVATAFQELDCTNIGPFSPNKYAFDTPLAVEKALQFMESGSSNDRRSIIDGGVLAPQQDSYEQTIILTPKKALQDQYTSEFAPLGVVSVKGRSALTCDITGKSCSNCPITSMNSARKYKSSVDSASNEKFAELQENFDRFAPGRNKIPLTCKNRLSVFYSISNGTGNEAADYLRLVGICDYQMQFLKMRQAPIVVMNYHSFYTWVSTVPYSKVNKHKLLGRTSENSMAETVQSTRPTLLVVDEAHEFPKFLCDTMSLTFDIRDLFAMALTMDITTFNSYEVEQEAKASLYRPAEGVSGVFMSSLGVDYPNATKTSRIAEGTDTMLALCDDISQILSMLCLNYPAKNLHDTGPYDVPFLNQFLASQMLELYSVLGRLFKSVTFAELNSLMYWLTLGSSKFLEREKKKLLKNGSINIQDSNESEDVLPQDILEIDALSVDLQNLVAILSPDKERTLHNKGDILSRSLFRRLTSKMYEATDVKMPEKRVPTISELGVEFFACSRGLMENFGVLQQLTAHPDTSAIDLHPTVFLGEYLGRILHLTSSVMWCVERSGEECESFSAAKYIKILNALSSVRTTLLHAHSWQVDPAILRKLCGHGEDFTPEMAEALGVDGAFGGALSKLDANKLQTVFKQELLLRPGVDGEFLIKRAIPSILLHISDGFLNPTRAAAQFLIDNRMSNNIHKTFYELVALSIDQHRECFAEDPTKSLLSEELAEKATAYGTMLKKHRGHLIHPLPLHVNFLTGAGVIEITCKKAAYVFQALTQWRSGSDIGALDHNTGRKAVDIAQRNQLLSKLDYMWEWLHPTNRVSHMPMPGISNSPIPRRALFMSGSINPEDFCEEMGIIGGASFHKVAPPQSIDSRPFIYLGSADTALSFKSMEANLANSAELLANIILFHATWRGIIHTHSTSLTYSLQKLLRDRLPPSQYKRIIWHYKGPKEGLVADFIYNPKDNRIFASPSLVEGFDGKGDIARWQVILKVPYMPRNSGEAAARLTSGEEGEIWYNQKVVEKITQAYGRVNRGGDDLGVTYMLDGMLPFLIHKLQELKLTSNGALPDMFMDAIRHMNDFVFIEKPSSGEGQTKFSQFPARSGSPRHTAAIGSITPAKLFK